MSTRPTSDQIKAFLAGPADQPVVMLNLLHFKSNADASHEGESGEQAHMRYAVEMRKFVESRGGRFIWAGEGGKDFRFAALMEYPSRAAFLKLAGDPQIAATIGKHRDAGLESQWLFAMTEVSQ